MKTLKSVLGNIGTKKREFKVSVTTEYIMSFIFESAKLVYAEKNETTN
jgi:hypothetical protein